tara:strand:- start:431 stop:910 length:480 start_codon:yes stop_codon:yes gene_type:complete
MNITKAYLNKLSLKDTKKQVKSIDKSKRLYNKEVYFIRPKLKSFVSKNSRHVKAAKSMYAVKSIKPSRVLAKQTGCRMSGLKKIVKRGKGAYYSSGSRPSQTPESWGVARLASSLTGGKASGIDRDILMKYCQPKSKPVKLAKTRKQGQMKAKKIRVGF